MICSLGQGMVALQLSTRSHTTIDTIENITPRRDLSGEVERLQSYPLISPSQPNHYTLFFYCQVGGLWVTVFALSRQNYSKHPPFKES